MRVLLIRPDIVFLDEASSAMDGDTEAALYALLADELAGSTIVSIAHRETVAQYHDLRWQFVADGVQAADGGWRYRIEATALSAPDSGFRQPGFGQAHPVGAADRQQRVVEVVAGIVQVARPRPWPPLRWSPSPLPMKT